MASVVPIIVGPTAVGKTALSVLLSEHFPLEVVSADSRQIYKYMDIGTAKPDKAILQKIKHHFIDILEPDAYYSAGMFGKDARQVIKEIRDKGILPLVVGGSGLYIRALVDGLFEADLRDEALRRSLKEECGRVGLDRMYERLQKIDAPYAAKISPSDQKRILRALEVWELSGKKISELQKEKTPAEFVPLFFGLTAERPILYERINRRVDEMLKSGLLEEVEKLYDRGYTRGLNALNTVGYKEVFDYLEGKLNYNDMEEHIKRNTRRYAKRQLTWFRQDSRIRWIQVDTASHLDKAAEIISAQL